MYIPVIFYFPSCKHTCACILTKLIKIGWNFYIKMMNCICFVPNLLQSVVVVCIVSILACTGSATLGMHHLAYSQVYSKELPLLYFTFARSLLSVSTAASICVQSWPYTWWTSSCGWFGWRVLQFLDSWLQEYCACSEGEQYNYTCTYCMSKYVLRMSKYVFICIKSLALSLFILYMYMHVYVCVHKHWMHTRSQLCCGTIVLTKPKCFNSLLSADWQRVCSQSPLKFHQRVSWLPM